jgi:hypothetical protein
VPEAVITPLVVAVAQHDRQRDQAHGDDRGRHDAGGGGQQRANEHHGVGEPAAHPSEQLADGVEQFLGHAAALQHQPHEGEKRDRQQRRVGDDAVDALGQRLHETEIEESRLDADEGEQQPIRRERECHRIAEQQENHQPGEHEWRHHRETHTSSRGCSGVSFTPPRRKAMRLMTSATP